MANSRLSFIVVIEIARANTVGTLVCSKITRKNSTRHSGPTALEQKATYFVIYVLGLFITIIIC